MKRNLVFFIFVILGMSLFAQWQVGDIVDDYSWTDSNDEYHSIYTSTVNVGTWHQHVTLGVCITGIVHKSVV